jgi:hypothetical protein
MDRRFLALAKRRLGPTSALLLSFAAATSALAQGTTTAKAPVRLGWTRALNAESCPEASAIEADVTRRLGENPFSPDAPGSIDVSVAHERGEWTAVIEDRTAGGPAGGPPAGSRIVTSAAESCDSLALAVGLAVALMIRERASSEPVEVKKPEPAPPPLAPAEPRCPRKPSCDERRHVAAFANAVAAFGVLPHASFGGALGSRIPLADHASLIASLTFLPEQRTGDDSGDSAFGATFGGLSGCFDSSAIGPLRFSGCASVLLGALHVVVWTPAPVEPGASFWGAGALGARTDWTPVTPIHLLVGVDALIPFERRTYVVELEGGSETAFTEPAWGGLVSAGLGVEL